MVIRGGLCSPTQTRAFRQNSPTVIARYFIHKRRDAEMWSRPERNNYLDGGALKTVPLVAGGATGENCQVFYMYLRDVVAGPNSIEL